MTDEPSNIVGLDLSLNGTAICLSLRRMPGHLFSPAQLGMKHLGKHYWAYVVRFREGQAKTRTVDKWAEIMARVMVVTFVADLVTIEDYAYHAHGRAITAVAEVGGIVRFGLSQRAPVTPWVDVNPAMVKKFATGNGLAQKDTILKEVYRRWRMNLDDTDTADAFILAKIGEALSDRGRPCADKLTVWQSETIDRIQQGPKRPKRRSR